MVNSVSIRVLLSYRKFGSSIYFFYQVSLHFILGRNRQDELYFSFQCLIKSHRRTEGDGLLSHIHTCCRNGFRATEGRLDQHGMRRVGTQMTCCYITIDQAGVLRDQAFCSVLYLVEFVEGQVVFYEVADGGSVY